jgi:hypothetical protein
MPAGHLVDRRESVDQHNAAASEALHRGIRAPAEFQVLGSRPARETARNECRENAEDS